MSRVRVSIGLFAIVAVALVAAVVHASLVNDDDEGSDGDSPAADVAPADQTDSEPKPAREPDDETGSQPDPDREPGDDTESSEPNPEHEPDDTGPEPQREPDDGAGSVPEPDDEPSASDVEDLTTAVVQSTLANARDFEGDYCRPYGEDLNDPVGDTNRWPLFIGHNGPGDGGDFYNICFIGQVTRWPIDVLLRDPVGDVAGSVRLWASERSAEMNFYDDDVLLLGEIGTELRFSGIYVSTPGAEHVEVHMLLPHRRREGPWAVQWSDGTETVSSSGEVVQSCPAEQGPVSDVFAFSSNAWRGESPDASEPVDNCIFVPDMVGRNVAETALEFRESTALLERFIGVEPSIVTVADCSADTPSVITAQDQTPNSSLRFEATVVVDFVGPCPTAPDVVGLTVSDASALLEPLLDTHPYFSFEFISCLGETSVVTSQSAPHGEPSGRLGLFC